MTSMYCARRRTFTNIQKVAEGENRFLSRVSGEQNNFKAFSKDCVVSSAVQRNPNQRCAILTLFSLESNGDLKIVAVPVQYSDSRIHTRSGSGVNSLESDKHKAQKGPATNKSCSVTSLTDESFSVLDFHHQSRDKDLTKKEDKATKRNSKKKSRKKKKRNKRISGNTGLTELECTTSEPDANKAIDEVDASGALVPSVLQSVTSEHGLFTSENKFSILSEVQETHCKVISCYDDPNSNVYSEANDSLVLDSLSLGSNSDKSFNADEESAGIDLSAGYIAKNGDYSPRNILNDVVDSNNHSKRAGCVRQGCTSIDGHSEVLEKRDKQIKRVPNNLNVYEVSSVGNLRGRSGKENNHSVWQKVQRNDADECNYESTKVNSVCSEYVIGLKEDPLLKKHQKVVDLTTSSKSEDKIQTKLKVSGKMKGKTSPGSKQEYSYFRKGSHATNTRSNLCSRNNVQHNEILDSPAQASEQKELDTVLRSQSKIGCPRIGFQSKRVESVTCKPFHSSQVCPNEIEPLESVHTTVSSLNDRNAENQISSSSRPCDSLKPSELLEEMPAVQLHTFVDDEGAKVDEGVSAAYQSKQNTSSGAITQKWIHVGGIDIGLPSFSHPSSLSMAKLDEPAGESWTLQNTEVEELASDSQTPLSSIDSRVMCTRQSSENVNSLPSEDVVRVQKLGNRRTCTPKDQDLSASEIDLRKIVWALDDAHRAQWYSEAIQMATGCPIAEFEILLHSASPIICPSYNILGCQSCLRDQVIGASLCRHETPNISLGNLWEWYGIHGCYGLEVRVEDYENSKRLGTDNVAFRAYFVPSLSAVQLFRKCNGHHTDKSNEIPGTGGTKPHTQKSSYSELSSVHIKDNASIQPADGRCSDDLELLFEYFESEQPHNRRPLFEMIKELVKGDGPSQCRAYGDPDILNSVGLHDLHPKSWYSVAWYPICKIPDGNFRAAFLTYHSLGHFVRRGSTFDSLCGDACIVSPVVGLQSYNAQSEGWFRPRHSAAQVSNLNPAGILKERLRTLENTASLLARAVVTKGGQTYTNTQPDYEFFLSRRL